MSIWRYFVTCAIILGVVQISREAYLRLYCNNNVSLRSYIQLPMKRSEALLSSECYKDNRENFFFAFGYSSNSTDNTTEVMMRDVISLRNYNAFLLNWQEEASGDELSDVRTPLDPFIFLGTGYNFSAIPDAYQVGIDMGKLLVRMQRLGMNLDETYLVGHSLGAQLIGQAGRTAKAAGAEVKWLYGLDPAGPFFAPPRYFFPINSGDGKAVLCLHTDPGFHGINKTNCDVDIFANFLPFTSPNVSERLQPGCEPNMPHKPDCSHARAVFYFVESMVYKDMVASKAQNVWDWSRGLGTCSDTIVLGLDWNLRKRGSYFMNTSASSPYGLGIAGSCPLF